MEKYEVTDTPISEKKLANKYEKSGDPGLEKRAIEIEEGQGEKSIESKIKNLTSDERAYLDIKVAIIKAHYDVEDLLSSGKIDRKTEGQLLQILSDINHVAVAPLLEKFEKLNPDKSQNARRVNSVGKLAKEILEASSRVSIEGDIQISEEKRKEIHKKTIEDEEDRIKIAREKINKL